MNITDKITSIIETYHATTIEANNLAYLMGMRKELSVYAFELGISTAKYKRLLEETKAQRKSKFARQKLNHLENSTLGKAELLAEQDIEEIRMNEARLDGNYIGSKIILEQCNEVINSMQQDISQLKLEYKNEL
jgi:hypothetical protein